MIKYCSEYTMRNIVQGCGQEMNVVMAVCNISHNAQSCAVHEFIATYGDDKIHFGRENRAHCMH